MAVAKTVLFFLAYMESNSWVTFFSTFKDGCLLLPFVFLLRSTQKKLKKKTYFLKATYLAHIHNRVTTLSGFFSVLFLLLTY